MKMWLTPKFELLWICGKNGILHIDKANKSFEKHGYTGRILVQNSLIFKSKIVYMQQVLVLNKVPFSKKELI